MVNNSTNINKTNNNLSPKESLNSEGQQFHQYKTNNNLSPKEKFKIPPMKRQQFSPKEYQQNIQ